MDTIRRHLNNAHHVLLASHDNPDGDAIGSLLALGLYLDGMQKTVTLFNESPMPAVYRFLPAVDRVVADLDNRLEYDTVIVLDCGDIERVGEAAEWIRRMPLIMNIDHHATNTYFGHVRYVDADACATAEIV